MKNLFVVRAFAFVMAISLFACSDDKKSSSTHTETEPATENTAPAKVSAVSAVHPTEQKVYDLSSAFMEKIEAAIAEPDDNKAIAMLNNIEDEMAPQTTALKTELESWLKSLSESEKDAFGERLFTQPVTQTVYKMMGDPKLAERVKKNSTLREAFENANAGLAKVWKGAGTDIEDSEE